MIQVLIALLFILIFWTWWQRHTVYLKFPCYFWVPFELIQWVFTTKKHKTDSFNVYFFQKVIDICKRFENEGMCVMWLDRPILLVYGEETMKFFSNEATLVDKPTCYKFLDTSGQHSSLLLSNGEKWRKERKLIAPAFKFSIMKEMVPTMNKHAAGLVEELSRFGNEIVDNTLEHVKLHSIKLFCESTMGITTDSKEGNNMSIRWMEITEKLFKIVSKRMFNVWLHFDFIWNISSLAEQYLKTYQELYDLYDNNIFDWKEKITSQIQTSESNPRHYRTFIEVLIEQHVKDPSFTKDDLKGQLFTILTGGYDTVSTSITWTLWLLGLHQDIQEKAYEEVSSVTNEYVELDDTRKLIYLECIIKESLRLYPVVPLYAKTSRQDIYFGKRKIPKHTSVCFFPYILQRNPKIYPDPESFDPDRFWNPDANTNPWTLLPFAEGTRSCIGKNFAMLEMKILLTHLLRRFKIVSLDSREDILESWEILLQSATPLRMKFLPRTQSLCNANE